MKKLETWVTENFDDLKTAWSISTERVDMLKVEDVPEILEYLGTGLPSAPLTGAELRRTGLFIPSELSPYNILAGIREILMADLLKPTGRFSLFMCHLGLVVVQNRMVNMPWYRKFPYLDSIAADAYRKVIKETLGGAMTLESATRTPDITPTSVLRMSTQDEWRLRRIIWINNTLGDVE